MAARYLLIEFDDEASSTHLREQIDNATQKGRKFRIVGLFGRPNDKTCQCSFTKGERSRDRIARGGKLGWWVCTTCKLPRLGDHQLLNLLSVLDILKPHLFSGVDTLMPNPDDKNYTRYPAELVLHTLPSRLTR